MSLWDTQGLTERVVARYRAGDTPAEIARDLGVTRNTINAKLDRLGVLRRIGDIGLRVVRPPVERKVRPAAKASVKSDPPASRYRAPPVKPDPFTANAVNFRKPAPAIYAGDPRTSPVQETLDVIRANLACAPLPTPRGELTPTCDLLGLGSGMCRWPIGDPIRPGFGFCGRRADDGTYYPVHTARAFAPRTEAQRAGDAARSEKMRRSSARYAA